MAKRLQKQHWLVQVLRKAGVTGGQDLGIDPGAPIGDAWAAASEAGGVSTEALARSVADYFQLRVAVIPEAQPATVRLVPVTVARGHVVFPLAEDGRHLTVATSDPTDFTAEQGLWFFSGRKTVFEIAPPSAIEEALRTTYGAASPTGPGPRTGSAAGSRGAAAGETVILVVDDDPEDRLLVRAILEKRGFVVEEARDGDEALDRIRAGSHALVVLDLEMPTVGGLDVLATLRASGLAVPPVIVLNGPPDPAGDARLVTAGAADYLRKPVEPARLVGRVQAALHRARVAAG